MMKSAPAAFPSPDDDSEHARYRHLDVLGGLPLLTARYVSQTFARHSHEGFCLSVVESGANKFYYRGQTHIAPAGCIVLVNADEVHTGGAADKPGWSYQAIYPTPAMLAGVTRDLLLPGGGIPFFSEAVVDNPGLAALLRLSFDIQHQTQSTLLKESLLLAALTQVILRYGAAGAGPRPQVAAQRQVRLAQALLDGLPEQDFSLQALADQVGLSPYYFLRQFRRQTGLPPHAYQIQSRLRKARQLIRQGIALVDVAPMVGFHDQSHFHRHFKRSLGVTPGEYARSLSRADF